MNNPLIGLISLFNTLIEEIDPKMLRLIDDGENELIYISAPAVLITLFKTAMIFKNYLDITKYKRAYSFDCNNLVPSIDWAITIYHKDYCFDKNPWMIRKIPLSAVIKIEEGLCKKSIIYFDKLIIPTINNEQLN